jgi:hypothetical protein
MTELSSSLRVEYIDEDLDKNLVGPASVALEPPRGLTRVTGSELGTSERDPEAILLKFVFFTPGL